MELQAKLGMLDHWKSLCSFQLNVAQPITAQGLTHDNMAHEDLDVAASESITEAE